MKARCKWSPNARQQKIIDQEVKKYVLEVNDQYQRDFDAMLVWYVHIHTGYGKIRLKRFYEGFRNEYKRLVEYYQMPGDTGWLCRYKLKEIGVDLDEWEESYDSRKEN